MNTITKTILALLIPAFSFAQGPIDFESGGQGASYTWAVFENDSNPALQIIPNPDQSGINTSATVARFKALQAGKPWAGCESLHGSDTGPFFIDVNNAQIRIMVWKSEISDVGIKLVRPDGWSLGEIKVPNTVTNQWEQLTFDFSAHIGLTPAYDQVVVFPDFQARTSDQIIYFDNVFGAQASSIGLKESQINSVKVFPNPGNMSFRVESDQMIQKLKIFNLTGQLLMSQSAMALETEVDTKELPKGIYLIELELDNGIEIHRWVKQD